MQGDAVEVLARNLFDKYYQRHVSFYRSLDPSGTGMPAEEMWRIHGLEWVDIARDALDICSASAV